MLTAVSLQAAEGLQSSMQTQQEEAPPKLSNMPGTVALY